MVIEAPEVITENKTFRPMSSGAFYIRSAQPQVLFLFCSVLSQCLGPLYLSFIPLLTLNSLNFFIDNLVHRSVINYSFLWCCRCSNGLVCEGIENLLFFSQHIHDLLIYRIGTEKSVYKNRFLLIHAIRAANSLYVC